MATLAHRASQQKCIGEDGVTAALTRAECRKRHDELGQKKIKLGREIQEKWEKDKKTAPEKTSDKKDKKCTAELEYKKATDEMET